jgi:hypothetical protein
MTTTYELRSEQEYESEISQCVGVTGYHHWFFLNALADSLNFTFRAYAIDSGGTRLGVIPLLFRRSGPVSTAKFLPVGCIGPVIRGEALRADRIGELLHGAGPVLRRHRTIATRWAFSPGLRLSADALDIHGIEVFEWENFVMPATKSADDYWKTMSTGRRQSVRKTKSLGVTVGESSAAEITQWFPEQMRDLYQQPGQVPQYDLNVAQAMSRRLAEHPRMLWRTARAEDGSPLAMTASVIGDERLWGWQIVGPSVRGMSPHTLLHWDSLNWALERDLSYDLGGVPSDGIRVVKSSLGGEPETAYGAFRFRPSAAYKAANSLRNWGPVRANWDRMRRVMGA